MVFRQTIKRRAAKIVWYSTTCAETIGDSQLRRSNSRLAMRIAKCGMRWQSTAKNLSKRQALSMSALTSRGRRTAAVCMPLERAAWDKTPRALS